MSTAKVVTISLLVGDLAFIVALIVELGWPWGVIGSALTLAVTLGIVLPLLRSSSRAQEILEHGEPAEAMVLKMWDTGWTVNDDPRVGLLLEVRPPGAVPFQTEVKCVVSRLVVGTLQPGVLVEVRYDPQDRKRVQLVPGAAGRASEAPPPDVTPPHRTPAERLRELDDLRRLGLVTEEEYQAKRREILDEV